ncbi:MAG: hypothetical protein K2N27_09900 [Ruminococcus sp.]|nr:hypothetical protein [Ruminococcus sp.]
MMIDSNKLSYELFIGDTDKRGFECFICPETEFSDKSLTEIKNVKDSIWNCDNYMGIYFDLHISSHIVRIICEWIYVDKKYHKEILECLINGLNGISGISKVVIGDVSDDKEEDNTMNEEFDEIFDEMDFDWTKSMGLDKLGLYYEIKMDGMDGECFDYSIYLDGDVTEEKYKEICNAVHDFQEPYEKKDIYMGYYSVSKEDDKILIYLDLGNVKPQYEDVSINGILQALNNVSGIKSVIINEGLYDF